MVHLSVVVIRRNALELPEASGDRRGRCGQGKKLKVLFLGDSSVSGVGVSLLEDALSGAVLKILKEKYYCEWRVCAESKITTSQLSRKLENETKEVYDLAIVSIGMNDILDGIHTDKWLKDLLSLQDFIAEKFEVSRTIFSGMPPVHKLKQLPQPLLYFLSLKAFVFDQFLQRFCKKYSKCYYVGIDLPVTDETMAADGFHPNEMFYQIWAERICDRILSRKF